MDTPISFAMLMLWSGLPRNMRPRLLLVNSGKLSCASHSVVPRNLSYILRTSGATSLEWN